MQLKKRIKCDKRKITKKLKKNPNQEQIKIKFLVDCPLNYLRLSKTIKGKENLNLL